MTAEQMYQELDAAGLTPPVHWAAAPHEWREALAKIESLLEEEFERIFAEVSNK